jgi:hypothetical protein
VDSSLAIRAAAIQGACIIFLAIVMALLFSDSFFEDWGWLVGPLAWIGCAVVTASRLNLPFPEAILGAIGAGIISLLAVVIGLHWIGAVVAVILFGLWCGRLQPFDVDRAARTRRARARV